MSRLIDDDTWAVLTIYGEARGEPAEGKIGVAEVILNRMHRLFFSDGTVTDTVLRGYQFSTFNTGDPNRLAGARMDDRDPTVIACRDAWNIAKAGSEITSGAIWYHATTIPDPAWVKDGVYTVTLGHQKFYRPRA